MFDMIHAFASGFYQVFAWSTFSLMCIGIVVGFIVGILMGTILLQAYQPFLAWLASLVPIPLW